MRKISYRLFLYSPGAASATLNNSEDYFLGELYADNIEVNIKLQDVSTISFTMPKTINGQSNPRINEVLDNYVLELWYGKVDGLYSNGDFEKIRFIIYKTPQEFIDDKYIYKYNGFSLESLLEFKNLVSWEGILIKDFYRVISYNNLESPNDKFTEVNQSNTDILINSATNPKKYIIIQPSTEAVSPLDIFIFETRKNLDDDVTNRSSLVSYESTSLEPYNDDSFKPGFYYLDLGEDGFVDSIYIALPDNIKDFNGILTSSRLFSYHLYDNPIRKLYAVGINKNTGPVQNNFYLDLVAEEGDGDTSTYEGFTYQSQEEYFKNGLTIEQLMIGEQTPSSNVPTEDGILFSTGFILGDIHPELQSQYRSNLEFNNLTRYQAIKQIAETFDSIPVFDTVNNTVSFYPENPEELSPWLNNGLSLSYGAYLSALQKDIDSSKIITVAKGLGKDNIPITFVTPTGTDYWEDYQHFLDGYFISSTTGFTITYDAAKGLNIVYPSGFISSKWMPAEQAKVLGGWQYTRDYFHNIMLDNTEPVNIAHEKYVNLYSQRLDAIRTLIKLQTEVEQREALKFKYFTLKEYYIQQNKNNPGTYNDREVDYTNKYNEVSFLVGNSKRRLKKLENLIFDDKQDGTTKFTHKGKAVTTEGSAIIELIKPNFNLFVGQLVEGDGIPSGARIISIENGLKFTIDVTCIATVDVNSSVEIIFTEDLPESLAHKFFEVKTFLNKETWFLNNLETETINLNLLESFKREAVIRDSKIDDDFELLLSTIKHVDENKLPKVTIQANVADILAAEEAYRDWDKIKVGESINIYLPELDIDQESLVREIAINFEENTLSFVISTVRNYNRAILTSALKIVRELKNSEVNFNSYIYDVINYTANVAVPEQEESAENGDNVVTTGPEDENEDAPTTDPEGADVPPVDGATIDPPTETFEYLATKGVLINNGKVIAFDQYTPEGEDPYTVEVELSAENGFEIRKVEGSAENNDLVVTKQVYIDVDGNAVFAGSLEVGSTAYNQVIALAGEGTTVYRAANLTDLNNAKSTANINDILYITQTFIVDEGEPEEKIYIKDDIYSYRLVSSDPDVFDFVLDLELSKKISGSVGGWTIDSNRITANNDRMILDSDSDDLGRNPYLSIGQINGVGFEQVGVFLGIDGGTESAEGVAKLSLESPDNFLKWNGEDLLLKGNLSGEISALEIQNIIIDSEGIKGFVSRDPEDILSFYLESETGNGLIAGWTFNAEEIASELDASENPNIILNKAGWIGLKKDSYESTTSGAFLGVDTVDNIAKFNVGDENKYMKWTGEELEIVGDIGGTIGNITVGNITISSTGIIGTDGSNTTFSLNSDTGAGFIGGFNFDSQKLTATNVTLLGGSSPYLYFGTDTTPAYGDQGIFAGISSTDTKFSLVSGSTFLKYDTTSSVRYNLEIEGNAKIGPLLVGNDSTTSQSLTTTNGGLIIFTGSGGQSSTINATGQFFEFIFDPLQKTGVSISGLSFNATLSGVSSYTLTLFNKTTTVGTIISSVSNGTNIVNFSSKNYFVTRIRLSLLIDSGTTSILATSNTATAFRAAISINDFLVSESGDIFTKNITVGENNKDKIKVQSSGSGTLSRQIVLTTPATALADDRTIRLPDANGTITLNDAAQTFSAVKTFSARPVFTSSAVFGSAADAASSIEITSTGNIIFEGSTADGNETTLTAANPTADRTITLPDLTGTINVWSLIKSDAATSISHTGTASTTTITLNISGASIADGDLLAIEVSSVNSASQRSIVYYRVDDISTLTTGVAGISWVNTQLAANAGARRWYSMDLYRSGTTSLIARYCQYAGQASLGNLGSLTWTGSDPAYIWRIWKVL